MYNLYSGDYSLGVEGELENILLYAYIRFVKKFTATSDSLTGNKEVK